MFIEHLNKALNSIIAAEKILKEKRKAMWIKDATDREKLRKYFTITMGERCAMDEELIRHSIRLQIVKEELQNIVAYYGKKREKH